MLDCDRLRPIETRVVTDLKSPSAKGLCGFNSRPRQLEEQRLASLQRSKSGRRSVVIS